MSVARARMAVIVVALECYRIDHDDLPDTLEKLSPGYLDAVPEDPFTGAPFEYGFDGGWAVISSARLDRGGALELRLPVVR